MMRMSMPLRLLPTEPDPFKGEIGVGCSDGDVLVAASDTEDGEVAELMGAVGAMMGPKPAEPGEAAVALAEMGGNPVVS